MAKFVATLSLVKCWLEMCTRKVKGRAKGIEWWGSSLPISWSGPLRSRAHGWEILLPSNFKFFCIKQAPNHSKPSAKIHEIF